MSKPKYLYIDDELGNQDDQSVLAVAEGFNDTNLIEVTIEPPQDFRSQRADLIEKLKYFDGLILDLRLDQNMNLDVAYNAPAIAQELRTTVSNPNVHLRPCPIVLCSTDERMRATYDSDQTSHDLFDYKFLKGSEPDWMKFARKLNSLATGYKWLRENDITIKALFGRENLRGIDPRIIERFQDDIDSIVYDYAHFILKDLFHHPGPLIKERVMAARLGIDIEESGDAWVQFRDSQLNNIKYRGVFNEGWNRWWSDKLIHLFKEISNGKRLSSLNADERVDILQEALSIPDLVAAKPIPYCKSTKFWTICEELKRPLDPLEGFKVFESHDLNGWQEPKFLSFNAVAVEGVPPHKGLRPLPSEQKKIQALKEELSKK